MSHLPLYIMNRLNQTESAVFKLIQRYIVVSLTLNFLVHWDSKVQRNNLGEFHSTRA